MKQTRIAFAVPGDLASPTGGYAYARRLIREAPGAGLSVEHIPLPGGFPFPSPEELGETEERLRAIPHDLPLLIDGLALGAMPARLVRAIAPPVIALCHHPLALETGLEPGLAKHLRDLERAALAECAHIVTTSHATAAILVRDYGVPSGDITVAPPGTDPAPRAPAGGPCRILSVGSLTPRKGHDRLVEVLAGLRGLEWSLTIAGPERDSGFGTKLRRRIAELDLEDRITLTGALPLTRLTAAYQSADLFVLASSYEGFGMAFTEAMSHGLPTVGLECAAVAEATAGGAQLVDAEDLPGALRNLVSDPGRRLALADRCWTAAQTFLRWPQTAKIVAGALVGVTA